MTESNSDGGRERDDARLRRDYQHAIDCLLQCESVIDSLQEQLASKDERIAALEARIVEMSLELASSKAFEDEHRSVRRVLTVDFDGNCNDSSSNDDSHGDNYDERPGNERRRKTTEGGLSWSPGSRMEEPGSEKERGQWMGRRYSTPAESLVGDMTAASAETSTKKGGGSRERVLNWSLGSMSWGGVSEYDEDDDDVDCAKTGDEPSSAEDGFNSSSSSRMSINNLAQFFRKRGAAGVKNRDEVAEKGTGMARRPRPINKRMEASQLMASMKSLQSLDGVVFPSSFDEVVSKGCLMRMRSQELKRKEFG
eukprot:CAMPEP_0172528392 /NCGR_PEP_ID=MMETSP1067-20121228/2801_1 /TAXON_ID=265564 ORGANISM="Thalassiosira punctigera, Strain Tpunct2005C2" /NCGR_SAMPLE_ID=MMETSP1067 /ASSEMBLY_ACC=CAM_ASM_000444 /LENGTH=309 /DNA_ID=CAMNT_0013312289 /DNA_START=141 /DNA_END=1070 /DNA_ORIENTATION=-